MNWDLDYGELAKDEEFVGKCDNLKENLIEVQRVLDQLLPLKQQYDKLTLPAQIELDLFLAFTLNSLHWVHLRIQGEDPMKHPIKDELQRIKSVMVKWQEIKDREKRPTVDIEAAKRFVRSGLYDPYKATAKPQNKIIKFEDSDA
ncbi:nuclear nucleic acid-binding protein C1D-like [Plodia interpunctella]|uniref:nuclear nucleic acid-binding protein C1D-like n=1 Tax=Plodia interpunctella TaxID=58824 RepID=UPI0023686419|nr:nuclear nucleic acid-binding protein C1D-like [Plodia interpunctella]